MPRRRSLWWSLLALAVCAALAGWWLAPDRDPAPPEQVLPTNASASADRESFATAVPNDASTGDRASAMPAWQRPPIPANARWCPVRVVDAATGEPIAGAEVVSLYEHKGWSPWTMLSGLPPDDEERFACDRELLARTFGDTATSDARGVVRVAVAPRGASLYARHDNRYGDLHIDVDAEPPPGGFRIRLEHDREVRVQVLDATGQPAIGVPVRPVHDGEPERQNDTPVRYECVRTQAPDGIARLPHLQELWPATAAGSEGTWRMRIELPFLTDRSAPFDPWAPPAEPLVLQLPPTGQVLARTVFEGRGPDHIDQILLFPDDAQALRNENRAAWRTSEPDGWVVFRHVPLGQQYVARASFAGWMERSFEGPVAPGEVVRLEFAPRSDQVVIVGRLTDERGAPLSGAQVGIDYEWQVGGSGRGSGGDGVSTDSDGRFRYHAIGGGRELEHTRLDLVYERPDAPPLRAKLGPRTFATGSTDLGDVVMAPDPVLVAGRLQFPPEIQPFEVRLAVYLVEQVEANDLWQDAEGNFVVPAELGAALPTGPGALQVQVRGKDVGPRVPFTPGQQDLVVPVVLGAGLWATVLLPHELPYGLFGHLRSTPDAEWNPWHRAWPEPHDRGVEALHWRDITPGRYTLELRLEGVAKPLLSLADVEVPGPAAGDPRLLGIDLRSLVQVVTVRVAAAAPFTDRLARATLQLPIPQQPPTGRTEFRVVDGVARCLLPAGPRDLFVRCPDLQTVALAGVQGEVTVVLQPWPEVQLTFPDLPALPAGVTVTASLAVDADTLALHELQPNERREISNGTAMLRVGPGSHRIRLTLQGPVGSAEVEPAPDRRIRSDSGYAEIRVDIAPWQRAVEQVLGSGGR